MTVASGHIHNCATRKLTHTYILTHLALTPLSAPWHDPPFIARVRKGAASRAHAATCAPLWCTCNHGAGAALVLVLRHGHARCAWLGFALALAQLLQVLFYKGEGGSVRQVYVWMRVCVCVNNGKCVIAY